MLLVIGEVQRDQIHAHLERVYPDEGCGLLVGRFGPGARRVERVEPVGNRAPADRACRYAIDPEDFLAIEKRARLEGLEVVGFYHSHPDHPAEPSSTDRAAALTHYSYLIAGVRGGRVAELRAWRFDPDTGFAPESLAVVAAGSGPGEAGTH